MTAAIEKIKLKEYYTIEEYFEMEEHSIEKLEYYNGTIFKTSGGSINHNLISANIIGELKVLLRKNDKKFLVCTSDQKIHIPHTQTFVYPDAVVICEKIELMEGREDTILNPLLIVEVSSLSTRKHDSGDKFFKYQSIPSFKEYVLVEQKTPGVISFHKETEDTWKRRQVADLRKNIYLPSLGIEISLERIYENIDFEKV